jgi:hypothetical protein
MAVASIGICVANVYGVNAKPVPDLAARFAEPSKQFRKE